MRALPSCVVFLALACGSPSTDDAGIGRDAGVDSGANRDAGPDAGQTDGGATVSDAGSDAGAPGDAGPPVDAGPAAAGPIVPVPGEVTLILIQLPGVVQLGEASALVGPDGTLVLMDVGNASHDDDVREVVRTLNTEYLNVAHGFPRDRAPLEVDWIVLSHMHSDHAGGFEDLLTGAEAITVTRGVVHRGFVDVGSGLTESDFGEVCGLLRGALSPLDVPLCRSAIAAPCDDGDWSGPYPALDCDGLFLGDLDEPLDDADGEPSFVSLGGGARLRFLGADAFVSDGSSAQPAPAFGHSDNNEENARSLVTLIEHGAFRYHWGGDLTGSGDSGEPDIESHLVSVAGPAFYGALGVDVVHAHHHVRRTSSNATFVAALAPSDGRSRNVVGGINGGHIGSPHDDVLMRFGDDGRLGEGRIWITLSATGGDSHPALVESAGDVLLQTTGGGAGYRVEGGGMGLAFSAVR